VLKTRVLIYLGYRLGEWGVWVLFLAREKDLYIIQRLQTGSEIPRPAIERT